jgi:lipid-binding SYLF domain-containing protein
MRTLALTAALLSLSSGLLIADKATDERLANAAKAFEEIMSVPDKAIPGSVLNKAECVVVVPWHEERRVHRRWIVRARRGDVPHQGQVRMDCAGDGRTRRWKCRASDRWRSDRRRHADHESRGIDSLLKSKFTLGGDASVAAGPVGREASAETDAALNAKILSYSRSKGVFGGVSLQGTTLQQDEGAIKAVYGKAAQCVRHSRGDLPTPPAATQLNQVLTKYSAKGI